MLRDCPCLYTELVKGLILKVFSPSLVHRAMVPHSLRQFINRQIFKPLQIRSFRICIVTNCLDTEVTAA